MPATVALLEALHGNAEGYRFGVAIKPDELPKSARFTDNAALAVWLASWSALGYDVYHSCAAFAAIDGIVRRKASYASGARAFWVDLDVGAGKSFASQKDATAAAFAFSNAIKLPTPAVVSSGRGIHCYWLLDSFLDARTWYDYAARLKQACVQLGFAADPTRTADIASILRTPGTINHKNNSPVRELYLPPANNIAAFESLKAFAMFQAAAISKETQPLVAAASNIYSYEPSDPGDIADECAQVRLLRDWPATHAPINEPTWRGILGVLKHALDGEEVAHAWSVDHSAYAFDSTQQKLRGWAGGPTTCAYFSSHNGHECVGCPHAGNISSPIQLGRNSGVRPSANSAPAAAATYTPPPSAQVIHEPATFPEGFGIDVDGQLVHFGEDKKGNPETHVVCRSVLYLDRVARGELRDDRHFYVLKHWSAQEGLVSIEIPAKEFWGSQGMAALAGKGPVVEDADLFKKYMREAVHAQQTARKTGMMYEQCGWKENDTAFLVGTTLYRAGKSEVVQGTPEITYRGRMLGPRIGGSLAEWRRAVDELFGIGREAQSFALLASFGATLIRFLSTDEGGAIVSLVSRKSGRGKTTALAGVTSVWGQIHGLQLANADTAVAKGLAFGALGNLPVVFDELAARDPEVVRDFIEMFTNGRDKMRGTQDGEIKHTLATWQTILITASNTSLIDAIVAEGGSTATTMRVIELPVTLPPDSTRKGDALKETLHRNWGYAGDAYMRHLMRPDILAWAREHVVHAQQSIIQQHEFRPEHRFWARTLACCATAGILAHQLGLIAFPVGPILTWALEHLRDKALKVAEDATQNESAVDILVQFINDHVSEMLVCADGWRQGQVQIPRVTPKNKLSVRYNLRPQQLFISDRELRTYLVKREFIYHEFMSELRSMGVSTQERKAINLGAGTDFASGPQRCLEINCAHPALGNATGEIEKTLPTYIQNNVVPIR